MPRVVVIGLVRLVALVVLLVLAAPVASQRGPASNSAASTWPRSPQFKVITHDHLMPKNSLAVVSVSPMAEHNHELSQTGFYRLLQPVWENIPKDALGDFLGGNWVTEDLETVLTRGITFAWTGLSITGAPTWLAAINLGDAEHGFKKTLKAQMETLRRSGFLVHKEIFLRGELWVLDIPNSGLDVIYTIRDGTVIVGTKQEEIELAIKRLADGKIENLTSSQYYQSFCERQRKEGQPFFSVYVQPTFVVDQMLSMVPNAQRLRARQALGQLQLYKMRDLAFTLRAEGGLLHEFFWLTYPTPRTGLLAVLLGSAKKVSPQVADQVSPDAVYASVYHLNFRQIYESLVSLSGVFSHQAPQQINMIISNLETRARVSLTKDLLDVLSDEVVVQQWSVQRSATANMAVTIKLRDELRFRNAIEQLAKMINVQKYNVRGTTAYSLDMPALPYGLTPYLMVYKGHLVFATTTTARDKVMANLDEPRRNPRFAGIVASLNDEPNSISWGNCAKLGKELTATLSTQFGNPLADRELREALDKIGGEMIAVTTQIPEGFMVKSRSPYGNMYLCVALAFGLRSLILDMPGAAREQDPTLAQTREVATLLRQVADAQKLYLASAARDNNKNGVGEYGTIRELISTQCLPKELLGKRVGDDTYEADKFLVKVLLPPGPDNQEQRFAVIAWPDKRRRGLVFAITEAGLPQVNSIIAQAEGLNDCDPRDLFVSGRFDRGLVEGWRPVATASEVARARLRAAADAQRAQTQENRLHYKAVLEAEKTKRVTSDAIKALESLNSDIAARAAYTMGMLKAKDAVPSLCQLAASHEEVRVRRQAMAALTKIRDPRSTATSIRVLSDSDATVRAYAATNLGRLRAKAGVKPLINLLSDPIEGNGADHVAALLALTDIGDSRSLAAAAGVVTSQDTKISEALTYLFQKVSPRMEPEAEIKPLLVALDSKCLMLRRYVIQRLGVLKDPTTLVALENQLAKEDRQLQPLISVSLNAIRGHAVENVSFRARMEAWLAKAEQRWQNLSAPRKYAVVGSVAAVFMLFVVFLAWRKRRRRQMAAEIWAGMVSPGSDFTARYASQVQAELGHSEPDHDDIDHSELDHEELDFAGEHEVEELAPDEPQIDEEPQVDDEPIREEHAQEQYGLPDDSQEQAEGGLFDDWGIVEPGDPSGADSGTGEKFGRFTED